MSSPSGCVRATSGTVAAAYRGGWPFGANRRDGAFRTYTAAPGALVIARVAKSDCGIAERTSVDPRRVKWRHDRRADAEESIRYARAHRTRGQQRQHIRRNKKMPRAVIRGAGERSAAG